MNRASKLIIQSEKQGQVARLEIGFSVKTCRKLPNRHGAVRARGKFDAPVREEIGIVKEYTKSNRYLVEFPNGETRSFSRRWLQPISSASSAINAPDSQLEEEDDNGIDNTIPDNESQQTSTSFSQHSTTLTTVGGNETDLILKFNNFLGGIIFIIGIYSNIHNNDEVQCNLGVSAISNKQPTLFNEAMADRSVMSQFSPNIAHHLKK